MTLATCYTAPGRLTWAQLHDGAADGGDIVRSSGNNPVASTSSDDSRRNELMHAVQAGQHRAQLLESRIATMEVDRLHSELELVLERRPSQLRANHSTQAGSSSAPPAYNCLCTPKDPRCQPTGTVVRLELPPWNGDGGSVGVPPLDWSVEPLRGGICPSIAGIEPLPATCSTHDPPPRIALMCTHYTVTVLLQRQSCDVMIRSRSCCIRLPALSDADVHAVLCVVPLSR